MALVSVRARAEPPSDEKRAEALFDTAMQLQSGKQFADACELFAQSKQLAPGVGVSLHLADCYERMGRTASAWQEFDAAEKFAHARGDDKRADVAHGRAQALVPKLERLTLAASPAVSHEGWQVTLDGVPLAPDRWNAAMAIDPGDHTAIVKVPGQPERTFRTHLDGGTNAVTLQLDDAAPLSPASNRAAAPSVQTDTQSAWPVHSADPAASSSGDGWRPWAEVGLVAVAAAGVGFGSFFMIRRGHFIQEGPPADPVLTNQATTAATISFVTSGVALTSAFVLFFTTPAPKGQVGLVVAPMALAGGAGAIVRASF
jgi:serine/threonine-protein kinase